ncbi:MAG: TonB-dependent receptor, partial [Pirellulaceae bacterium]|nr:TonB-dependent receptor [Pirellulaceae bacterium]
DLKLYIYPLLNRTTGQMTTVQNLHVEPGTKKLYEYLVDRGNIEALDSFDPEHLLTYSREVLQQIQNGDPNWTKHVPASVVDVIQRRGFFGFKKPKAAPLPSLPTTPPGVNVVLSSAK